MVIKSPDFQPNQEIPNRFTCDGENISPTLEVSAVTPDAKELVMVMDDPDAPGGLFTHWIVWNIPINTTKFSSQSMPANAIEGTNDFGETGYGGPCPPSGMHRYRFNLYASSNSLELPTITDRASLESRIVNLVIDSAQLVGLYARK